jgi:endonuclease/exonuclease/phosphatase family metal-dependent hydrolase
MTNPRSFPPAWFYPSVRRQCPWIVGALLVSILSAPAAAQSTGTFIDRWEPTDLRVVSYNIWQDSIFQDTSPTQAEKFARVMQALQPDIINLQEIYDHSASQTASLMNSILPLGGGNNWFAYKGGFDNVIVSRYPFIFTSGIIIPVSSFPNYATALVNLPDEQYDSDFFFMNNHFKCCNTEGDEEGLRQNQADALVNWMRDARTPGGFTNVGPNTPMAVVGDLNIVGSQQPLNTLLTGNIINEGTFGSDSPPDWDGSNLTDAHPVHNGSGTVDYTYRYGPTSSQSRLDYVLYTDSVVGVANKFILNPVAMTSSDRDAAGLGIYDVSTLNDQTHFDHLPLVIDFRFSGPITGDYDGSGYVDEDDYALWRLNFGTSDPAADGNGDGIVDAADYSIWRDNEGAGTPPESSGGLAAVPEPASGLLWAVCGAAIFLLRGRRTF